MSSSGSLAESIAGDAPLPITRPQTGAQFGDYEIIRSLGSGGMGQVYAAKRAGGEGLVALKQLGVHDPTLLYRFKQEFRSLADLPHPNLVGLGELVVLPGELAFFTMELVEGQPLARWVRGTTPAGTLPNLHRLCHALRQLGDGVAHLHRAARVHRDLKPSNVLVTDTGRVVILDFGLIYELRADEARITASGQLVGTPAYMAPEQIHRRSITTAIDLYAIGVTLFECLTGCLPFGGSASAVLIDKQRRPAPDPRELVPGTPDWLAQLCRALLDIEPLLRPSAEHVVELFDRNTDAAPLAHPSPEDLDDPRLLGRGPELLVLERAHREVASAGATLVHLTGPRGRGKSALIEQFLDSREAAEGRPSILGDESFGAPEVILRGRCHPRESVPHKGFDSLADALARYLHTLAPVDAASLRPRYIRELGELLPVLRGIWPEPRRLALEHDPVTRRQRGIAAVREVLARIADTSPLIVFVDDLHWGDPDGFELLSELLAPDDEAPPAMLLILAYDDRAASASSIVGLAGLRTLRLQLAPLDQAEALALARALLDTRTLDDPEAAATTLATASGGEPGAIVHGATSQAGPSSAVAAEGQLFQRIHALEREARHLLELAAIAGVELPNALAREVLTIEVASFEVAAYELVMAGLLGAVALDSSGVIRLARPRIGELVRVALDRSQRQRLHLALARVLAAHESSPELIAEHFERGGDCGQARAHLTRAGDRAADALAFVRAKQLYQRALDLLPTLGDVHKTERRALQLALATQLAHLDSSCETIDDADDAPRARDPESSSPREQASQLRLRAAEDYAVAVRSDIAVDSLRAQMREHGEWLPQSPVGMLAARAVNGLRLRLRRWAPLARRASARPARAADEARTAPFDLVHATSLALSRRDPRLAATLRARVMELALVSEDPLRLVVALHGEITWLCASDRLRLAAQRVREAERIAASTRDPLVHAHLYAARQTLHAHEGRLRPAELVFGWALAALERNRGEHWLYAPLFHNQAMLLRDAGAYQRLLELLPRWRAQLHGFGRRADTALQVSEQVIVHAQLDERERARRHLDQARSGLAADSHDIARALLDDAEVWLLLAEGHPSEAVELARRNEAEAHAAGLTQANTIHARLLASRVRAELGHARTSAKPDDAPSSRDLRRLARLSARAQIDAWVVEAGRATLLGDHAAASQRWRLALTEAEARQLHGLAAALRWRLIELDPPDIRALEAEAHAYFHAEGIDEIEHFVRLMT